MEEEKHLQYRGGLYSGDVLDSWGSSNIVVAFIGATFSTRGVVSLTRLKPSFLSSLLRLHLRLLLVISFSTLCFERVDAGRLFSFVPDFLLPLIQSP